MALYKVGDRVVVRSDLVLNERYHMLNADGHRIPESDTFITEMTKHLGGVVTIKSINSTCGKYRIKECGWNWTDEMFAGLEDEVLGSQVEIDPDALDAVLQ